MKNKIEFKKFLFEKEGINFNCEYWKIVNKIENFDFSFSLNEEMYEILSNDALGYFFDQSDL